jgi:O-antigen/teichoic acid export membrane protein
MKMLSPTGFWKKFTVVIFGSLAAQAIPLGVLPILTRLLTPTELGPYFIWLGFVSVLSIFLSLRLDMAVFNAQTNDELRDIVQTSLIMAAALGVTLATILLVFNKILPNTINNNLDLWPIESLVLAALWASNMVLQSAYLYGGHFKKQAISKVLLAFLVAAAQLSAIYLGWGLNGLVINQLFATFIIVIYNIVTISKIYNIAIIKIRFKKINNMLIKYWRFPVFSMPADFISALAAQLPMLIIGNRFGGGSAGQFALMNKSMAAPIKLISGSVMSVFKEEASYHYRLSGECRDAFIKAFKRLSILGVAPFGILFFYSENIFIFIFGSEWIEAGIFASILSPMFYLQFVSSPLSYMLFLGKKQIIDLIWQLIVLIITSAVYLFSKNIEISILMYSIGMGILYALNIYFSFLVAKGN